MKYKIKISIVCLTLLLCLFPYQISSESISKPVLVSYDDLLNQPIKHIDASKPMVALTFDDGPTRKYTTMILDSLKEHQSYATFFVLGSRIDNAKDLLERMILEGHEIGNHTYHHKQLTKESENSIINEIDGTNQKIFQVTKNNPKLIRPPYGEYNETVVNHLGEMRVVTWTVDSEDWRIKDAPKIVEKIMQDVNNKSIILMHDLYLESAQAACLLIPRLIEEGYQLVTVSDLYQFE